jgi:hypothetical protein
MKQVEGARETSRTFHGCFGRRDYEPAKAGRITIFRRGRKSHKRFVMLDRRPSERFPSDRRCGVCRSTFFPRNGGSGGGGGGGGGGQRRRTRPEDRRDVVGERNYSANVLDYHTRNRRISHSCPARVTSPRNALPLHGARRSDSSRFKCEYYFHERIR